MRYIVDDLDAAEWICIGYVLGLLVILTVDLFSESGPGDWDEQTAILSEGHLRRLENGETVKVPRWHGHDLVLDASIVIDAEEVENNDA
jgi:hypothetical protein